MIGKKREFSGVLGKNTEHHRQQRSCCRHVGLHFVGIHHCLLESPQSIYASRAHWLSHRHVGDIADFGSRGASAIHQVIAPITTRKTLGQSDFGGSLAGRQLDDLCRGCQSRQSH